MAARQPDQINQLPEPPNPADRSTFNSRAYPWSEALNPWTDEVNAAGADTFYNAQIAEQSAGNAGVAVQEAEDAAARAEQAETNAAQSATAAGNSADGAASSATTAEAAKIDAVTAKNAAESYAGEARQSADEAASVILGQVFDDTTESSSFGWTSSKIVSWFNSLTTVFTRTILGRSNAQQVRDDLQLTYPATAPTVGDGVEVMRAGAGGWLGQGGVSATPLDYPASVADITNLTKNIRSESLDNGVEAFAAGIHFSTADTWGRLRVAYLSSRAWVQGGSASQSTGWTAELYHSLNTLNIGTTATSARAALNLFADASGVMTNGPGQLSNDMSNFLSSNTFDEMSSKVGGGGEIDFTTIADNATNLTPQPGKSYWLTKTGTAALTTQFACTHAPGKIRTWHVIVSKGAGANDTFIPNFSVSGLTETSVRWSGGGTIKPTISGVSHVMIMFMQIDQNVRATIVDGW